jgi:glyoxylase-like metal-dependent hydrolase (beta-lactamase superfamily II)
MVISLRRRLASVSSFLTFAFCLLSFALTSGAVAQSPLYEVHAVRFATVGFQVSSLVAGAERGRSIDIAFMVWVAKGGGHTVLVDAGFYRDKFITQWKPQNYVRPSEALTAGLGIKPEDVTDIIVSHSHWDHVDGADLFPRATVWIQKDEYEYYVGPAGEVLHQGGADADDAKMLLAIKTAGRLKLVDGDAQQILPGISVYTGGKHTYASQYAGVKTAAGTVVLASDNAYLYENLEKHLAIAQTVRGDPGAVASNLAAMTRMATIASSPRLIIPGHDPAVFERFPKPGGGVAEIK